MMPETTWGRPSQAWLMIPQVVLDPQGDVRHASSNLLPLSRRPLNAIELVVVSIVTGVRME